jgi:dihydrofolate synthase/folylpolyglutamate synthase
MAEARVPRPLHTLLAVLADKAWPEMVAQLAKVSDRLWLSVPPSAPPERRWVLEEVARHVPPAVIVEPDFDRALEQVRQGAGTALVTGSFHTVGDALARLPGFAPLG